jgi:xylulokinase
MDYSGMNVLAAEAPIGCDGISILPFGNGAERVLENREIGCSIFGVNFNVHKKAHLVRAAQEGVVFSFVYGMEIMREMGIDISTIHAGRANMFLNPVFREALACTSGATIELYETDGSVGSAKGAGIGAGIYADHDEAFATLQRLAVIEPAETLKPAYSEAYELWKQRLATMIK